VNASFPEVIFSNWEECDAKTIQNGLTDV